MNSGSYIVKKKIDEEKLLNNGSFHELDLTIELTERCNNNCVHCCINLPEDDIRAKEKEISTQKVKDILTEAASLGCLQVTMTGGEPLLREDFEEIYIFTRKLGIKVLLFTNATLIDTHIAKLFNKIPPLIEIEVTVYGMEKESYESVSRKKGTFEKAWNGIRLLECYNIPFVVKTVVLPQNKRELPRFKQWTSTIPWMTKEPMCFKYFGLRCRRDDEEKNRMIKKLRASPEEVLEDGKRIKENFLKGVHASPDILNVNGDALFTCMSGLNGGCVDAYGHFQPCIILRHPDTVFDLEKGTLKDTLEKAFPEIRKKRARHPDYLNRCGICFLNNMCEQCPGYAWLEHGVLDKPDEYLCAITHEKARYLGLIGKKENAWEVKDWRKRVDRIRREAPVDAVTIN